MNMKAYWSWAIAPTACALAITALVAVPNWSKSRQMRTDSKDLARATDQYLVQRDEHERLQVELRTLREELAARGHSAWTDTADSTLVTRLTRPIDGTDVVDQSIRIGDREPMSSPPAGVRLDRRQIDMQMTGSFDAIFAALGTAEREQGLCRVRSMELRQSGEHVQATVAIDEYFHGSEEHHP